MNGLEGRLYEGEDKLETEKVHFFFGSTED
jgi:hypothetical protein